jgi:serine/threonine protein kinase
LIDNQTLQGQKTAWSLLDKLGEGDAGEVFQVEGVVDQRSAILKRPRRSVFTNDVRRQADQIRAEGRTLSALENLLKELPGIQTPGLLDQSKSGTEFSERFFIVIERASGFDLAWLARISRFGLENGGLDGLPPEEQLFITVLAREATIPERILLAVLSSLLAIFEVIHSVASSTANGEIEGLIWNDVKPEHLFWDPRKSAVTVIDWGNSRALEAGGTSRDRRHSASDDQRQFIDQMGRFLSQFAPALFTRLAWPEQMPLPGDLESTITGLRERIQTSLRDQGIALVQARAKESELVIPGVKTSETITLLEQVQNQIILLGELPDYQGSLRLASGAVSNLAAAADLDGIRQLCNWAAGLPGAPKDQWRLLSSLAGTTAGHSSEARKRLADAVRAAAVSDWEGCLWALLTYLQASPEPDWWNDLLVPLRRYAGGEQAVATRPLLTLRRTTLTLQSAAQQLEDRVARSSDGPASEDAVRLARMRDLIDQMREIAFNWVQLDPLPPFSAVNYTDIDLLIDAIDREMPGAGSELVRIIEPAREQVSTLLSVWNRREFTTAARTLRTLFLWDPDRRRLLSANLALQAAPDWLQRVKSGPAQGVRLQNYVADLEFEGRELRNRIGPASWLDGVLEALKAIRFGAWPGDLFLAQPALLGEMPWLQVYGRAETLRKALQPHIQPAPRPMITGMQTGRFGPEDEIKILEPLDAWMPEARGSSARVYLCTYRSAGGDVCEGALKLMRIDKPDYGLPLFREEVLVLQAMQGVPGVVPLLESGFLWLGKDPLPLDHNLDAIRALHGEALRIGPDSSSEFLDLLESRTREGWTPYLIIEKQRKEDNLLLLCDASINRGTFLPLGDLLRMAIQICDILVEAHNRKVVYRDHKILHYYWQPGNNGIYVIDWNVARYHPEGLSDVEIHMDLVQLGARGMHHVLTGRTAPGALPLGPTRPEEIEQSAQSYRAQWTYDDQRLGDEIRTILEQLLAGSYTTASDLRDDLKRAYMDMG